MKSETNLCTKTRRKTIKVRLGTSLERVCARAVSERPRLISLLSVVFVSSIVAMTSQAGINRWTPSLIGVHADAVAVDATNPAIAYAATGAGIFKTTDRGVQWSLVEPTPVATAIAIDPQNHSRVISGSTAVVLQPVDEVPVSKTTLRLSDDGGSTWREIDAGFLYGPVMTFAFDPGRPGTIYAALVDNGIVRSVDFGQTWTLANRGLYCCQPNSGFSLTHDVAVSSGSSTIYAASESLFRSADGAENWDNLDTARDSSWMTLPGGEFEPYKITIDRFDPARLYMSGWFAPHQAHTLGPAALTSGDSGRHWQELPVGTLNRITIDPRIPTTLYTTVPVGYRTPARGVLRSTDRGATWTEFNDGLTNLEATSIEIDASGSLLYTITTEGVFVYDVTAPARRRAVSR